MIIGSAIMGHDDVMVWLPPPARHHHVINHMVDVLGHPIPINGQQGFLDDEKGFVDRIEAVDIVLHVSKQVKKLKWPPNLYSEDLW